MLLTVIGEVCPNPDQRFGADLSAMAASPCSITMVRKQLSVGSWSCSIPTGLNMHHK